jgi:hypothetical protein
MKDPIVITFNLGPTGRPMFSAHPELDQVPWGTTATLVWVLKPGPNASAALFHPEVGIRFVPSVKYPAVWPYEQPAPVPGTKSMEYAAEDPNTQPGAKTTVYKYNVTVVVDGKTYTWDPEEENEGEGS